MKSLISHINKCEWYCLFKETIFPFSSQGPNIDRRHTSNGMIRKKGMRKGVPDKWKRWENRILILNSVGLKTKSIKWDKERYFSMLKVVIHVDDVRIRNTDILNTTFTNQEVKEKQT